MAVRYRLKLDSLKFISLVDQPAQETAKVLLVKRAGADELQTTATMRVMKVGAGDNPLIYCWAFTCTDDTGEPYHDLQGDAVSPEFIKAAEEFLASGAANDEMHDENATGRIAFGFPMDVDIATAFFGKVAGSLIKKSGLMVAVRASKDALAKVRSGEYTGVSIAGTGTRELLKAATAKPPRIKPKPKKKPASDGAALPYKRLVKRAVLTSVTDGHQHTLDLDAPADCWSDTLMTSYQTSEGEGEQHCHAWVYDQATGAITIALDSGHDHTVTEVVPPDVIAAAAANDEEPAEAAPSPVTDPPSGGTTIVIAARAPISTPATGVPTVKGNSQENQPMDPKIAKMLSLALLLPEPQRLHVAKLAPDDQVAFLGLDATARDTACKAAEAMDPIVHTTKSGLAIRKSAGDIAVILAKQADAQADQLTAQAAELAISKSATEQVTLEKRAAADLSHFAKAIGVRAAIVKAVDGISDESIRKEAHEAIKGANAAMQLLGKAHGANDGSVHDANAPDVALRAAVEKFQSDNKLPSYEIALLKATESDGNIRKLYNAANAS